MPGSCTFTTAAEDVVSGVLLCKQEESSPTLISTLDGGTDAFGLHLSPEEVGLLDNKSWGFSHWPPQHCRNSFAMTD